MLPVINVVGYRERTEDRGDMISSPALVTTTFVHLRTEMRRSGLVN